MSNHQRHRGQHSNDAKFFSAKWQPILRQAVRDLSYLLTEDYPDTASLKLVGDRYRLAERQRMAVLRSACANQALINRHRKQIDEDLWANETLVIDTYNLLITIESALSNGLILVCRDGCFRDLASIHGTYKRVEETLPAIQLIGNTLAELKVKNVKWFLDSPISNSGRLKGFILAAAQANNWQWEAELVHNPDKALVETGKIVVSSDSWVIDNAVAWANVAGYIIEQKIQTAQLQVLG
jgi:hypothetical protein